MTETAPAGWYTDPENPTQQRYWDGVAWTQHVAPASSSEDARQGLASPDGTAQPIVDAPVLRSWKTSVGFSVLGLFVGFPLLVSLGTLLAMPLMILTGLSSAQQGSGGPELSGLVGNILMLIYALAVYPSYFSEKPRLKSSRAISFANLMFGGLVFGLLWNGNLTKKTKGISYVVFAVLSGLTCVSLVLIIFSALLLGGTPNSTYTSSSSSSYTRAPTTLEGVQPLERIEGAKIYTDVETGASFVVPSTASEEPLKERQPTGNIKTRFYLSDAYVSYGSNDMATEAERRSGTMQDFDSMEDFTEKDIHDVLGAALPDATIQRTTLNGLEYFVARATMSDGTQSYSQVVFYHMDDGYMYYFSYNAPADREDESVLRTFYSMVASMVYPEN